jgi:hypothetical protein
LEASGGPLNAPCNLRDRSAAAASRALNCPNGAPIRSIKLYLTDNYHIAASDLVTVGYGKSRLKDPSRPLAEVNRRVHDFNMTAPKASKLRAWQPTIRYGALARITAAFLGYGLADPNPDRLQRAKP